ncbi:MAG: hypothetical protein EOO59_12880, partial [Hymenobacter sp.]
MQGLAGLALLSTGVVYGTDVFFALVARPALRRADEASLTRVLGHLHAVADVRMPWVGATACRWPSTRVRLASSARRRAGRATGAKNTSVPYTTPV